MVKYDDLYLQQTIPLEAIQVEVIQPVFMDVAKQPPCMEIVDQIIRRI